MLLALVEKNSMPALQNILTAGAENNGFIRITGP